MRGKWLDRRRFDLRKIRATFCTGSKEEETEEKEEEESKKEKTRSRIRGGWGRRG